MVEAARVALTAVPGRTHRSRWTVSVAGLVLTAAAPLLAGCGPAAAPAADGPAGPAVTGGAQPAPTEAAREGRSGSVVRLRFRPERVTLADGSHAPVVPASTVHGLLEVPTDVREVGWWDGSAAAGDPFGATVIAGHVDSRTQGLGYFARLRSARPGDVVVLSGHSPDRRHARLRYRITRIRQVERDAVSADSAAFGQTGAHRLVLITCGGAYLPARGGYQDNVVITAEPLPSS